MELYQKIKYNEGENDTAVKRLSDNVCIPFDQNNSDYQIYLEWLNAGNKPLEINEIAPENFFSEHKASLIEKARLLSEKFAAFANTNL